MRLTPGERAVYARWPDQQLRDIDTGHLIVRHADGRDYMRLLLGVLLSRHRRLMIEAAVLMFADDVPYFECLTRLRAADLVVEAKAGGSTPAEARFNAELFAVRRAVLGEEVPVLGRLLRHQRLVVELRPHKGDPQIAEWYDLVLAEDRRALPGETLAGQSLPLTLPCPTYTLRVSLQPPTTAKRTRYLTVDAMPPDLAEVVRPFMAVPSTIYVHRLLLALQGCYLNDLLALNDVRAAVGATPYEDRLLHGHHVNGVGYDDRQANLQPLTPAEHARRHDKWLRDYNDLAKGMQYRADRGVRAVLLAPPRIVVSADHYDMTTERLIGPHPAPGAAHGQRPMTVRGDVHPPIPALSSADHTPVSLEELRSVAGRRDAERNMVLVLRALVNRGGMGTFREIKNARSLWRLSENTVRRHLDRLVGARIILCCRLHGDVLGGKGAELHYRLARPLAADLQRRVLGRSGGAKS